MIKQPKEVVRTPLGTMAVHTAGVGPAVLLVHGIPGSSGAWIEVVEGLVDSGFRVLVPDLLGFGSSDRPTGLDDLWIDGQATALAHVLEALEATPAIVVGHDYGAPIAVAMSQCRPRSVSALVLAAGNLFTDTPIPAPLNVVAWPAIGGLASRVLFSAPMLRMMLRVGVGRPCVRLDPATYLGDPGQRGATRTILAGALRQLAHRYGDVEAALPRIEQPTTVLWGGRDPFFDVRQARRTAAAIPNATLQVDRDAGHFLPAERPAAFITAVRLLNRHVQEATP